jgi:hypothetical protein
VIKFAFKIKTRGGMVVDSLMVAANNRAEAERKIVQIYHHCKILDCHELQPAVKEDGFNLESAITLISKEADLEAPPKKPS